MAARSGGGFLERLGAELYDLQHDPAYADIGTYLQSATRMAGAYVASYNREPCKDAVRTFPARD